MRTVIGIAVLLISGPAALTADDFKLEPGFKPFFNGKDLTGWKLRGKGTSLDGKTATEKNRFQVTDGKLVIDGKSRGNMVIDSAVSFEGDVHIKFAFLADEKCNNDLYLRGLKFDIKKGKGGVANLKPGEWQTFEIIIKGDQADFLCDGQSQRKQKVKSKASPLGIRAEFGGIQYRHLRYK